eukprot:scaffold118515_cov28-Tisochrysis_lutea.AAC.6
MFRRASRAVALASARSLDKLDKAWNARQNRRRTATSEGWSRAPLSCAARVEGWRMATRRGWSAGDRSAGCVTASRTSVEDGKLSSSSSPKESRDACAHCRGGRGNAGNADNSPASGQTSEPGCPATAQLPSAPAVAKDHLCSPAEILEAHAAVAAAAAASSAAPTDVAALASMRSSIRLRIVASNSRPRSCTSAPRPTCQWRASRKRAAALPPSASTRFESTIAAIASAIAALASATAAASGGGAQAGRIASRSASLCPHAAR